MSSFYMLSCYMSIFYISSFYMSSCYMSIFYVIILHVIVLHVNILHVIIEQVNQLILRSSEEYWISSNKVMHNVNNLPRGRDRRFSRAIASTRLTLTSDLVCENEAGWRSSVAGRTRAGPCETRATSWSVCTTKVGARRLYTRL